MTDKQLNEMADYSAAPWMQQMTDATTYAGCSTPPGAAPFEQLSDLYRESLCQDAYYNGAAGTIVDAVVAQLHGNHAHIIGGLIDAAAKLTHDAMGFVERTISLIHDDLLSNECDWARIDDYFKGYLVSTSWISSATSIPMSSPEDGEENRRRCQAWNAELPWVIEQLNKQSQRVWKIYFDYAGRSDLTAGEGRERLGMRWHHDLALAATFFEAAAMLLSEVKS